MSQTRHIFCDRRTWEISLMQDARDKNIGLTKTDLAELRKIILKDYRVDLNDQELERLGFSLLKITRLALAAFNRAEDKRAITTTS